MSLLSISEPNSSNSLSSCHKKILGIDLGTTHSLIAAINEQKIPFCIPDPSGELLCPSVVHYSPEGKILVGREAEFFLHMDPQNTFHSIKRCLGISYEEIQKEDKFSYFIEPYAKNPVLPAFRLSNRYYKQVTPIEISSEILKKLRKQAEAYFLEPIKDVVITVPAYFDEGRRQAIKAAGEIAGLRVNRLLNEPTAAALAYGLAYNPRGFYAIYDFGGGTFDVSILELVDGVFSVKSTFGNTFLGGDDIDSAIIDLLLQKFARYGFSYEKFKNPTTERLLRQKARQVKHLFSQQESFVTCDLFDTKVSISKIEFEELVLPFLLKTGYCLDVALAQAKLNKSEIDGVVLVGGSTRMPLVQKYVHDYFGQKPLSSIDPDQVVALGAAIQGSILTKERSDLLLLDITPLSLGIEVLGGTVETLIPRNTPIPTVATQHFTTHQDGQTGFSLHIVQGERELAKDCRSLAKFLLSGIPTMPIGKPRLEVSFLIDENGLLQVSAKELITGKETFITIEPSHGLAKEEIEQMIQDGFTYAKEDKQERKLLEIQTSAHQLLNALKRALNEDASLLSKEEEDKIKQLMKNLEFCLQKNDSVLIDDSIKALENQSQHFYALRLEKHLSSLQGKSILDLDSQK